jgi:hypothetical protein
MAHLKVYARSSDDLIEVVNNQKTFEVDIGVKQFTKKNAILPGEHRKQPNEFISRELENIQDGTT